MRKKITMLISVIGFTVSTSLGQLKIDIPHFMDLYNAGRFGDLFNEAVAMRNSEEFGKIAVLDYFISKALCGNQNFKSAERGFEYILTEYPLTQSQKKFIVDEFASCRRAEASAALGHEFILSDFKLVNTPNVPVAKIAGKLGYVLDCNTDPEAYKFNPDFNRQELQNRLFQLNEKQKAENYYRNFLGNDYDLKTSGRFVFITKKPYSLTSDDVKAVTTGMEKAYAFFHNFYKIRPPDKLIAVYLMGDKETLRTTAKKVHGLGLPESNIGYSSLDDLSILGNSDATNIGTIYHELFHLMVRTDVGDIPAWLDEGIACLYETSMWQHDSLKGMVKNWRTAVLTENLQTNHPTPQLKMLVDSNWNAFILQEKNKACDVALNYAVAKHFAIYMQEHGLLQKVVQAFKNRKNVFTDTSSKRETDLELLEKAIGMKIDNLQTDFDKWMNQTYDFKTALTAESLSSKFEQVRQHLETYKFSGSTQAINSDEYKQLEKTSVTIRKQLDSLWNNARRPTSPMEQFSPTIVIPEELRNLIIRYLSDAEEFDRKYPLR
jgi:hypothetical protein